MELLNNSNVQSMFTQLGNFVDDEFVHSNDCYSILMHIYDKLHTEDTNSRSFRITIGFSQVVKKDLIPILIGVNNDKILQFVIKILADIMTPIECLVHIDKLFKDEIGCSTILKLNWLLTTSKIACVNLNVIKIIIHVIKENIIKISYSQEHFNSLNIIICDCLRLIKNVLHVPNDHYQNYILWMLFSEKFDEILLDLIANSNRGQWAVLIIEIIALIFKNVHVDQMAKQLSKMNETVISDSSEDNESNTSLHSKNGRRSSEEESGSLVSDDNDTEQPFNVMYLKKPIPTEYETHLCNIKLRNEENKSSSNRLPSNLNLQFVNNLKPKSVFVKPAPVLDMCNINKEQTKSNELNKEQRRSSINQLKHELLENKSNTKVTSIKKSKFRMKKNTKKMFKSKLNLHILPINMPSEECIYYFLQKFTVRFIQNGFNTLVDEIYNLLTTTSHRFIDTSLYFWILTYFCRFCKLNQTDLKSVKRIVSFKLISYIVHEGLKISEQLMIAKRQKSPDIHLQVRHLHLVIMAIKEVIKTITFYIESAVTSPVYIELIKDLKNSGNNSPESITWINDLKSIFALLIRHYDSDIQIIDYLHDLIVTNHMVLLLFDNLKDCWNLNNGINAHIKTFAAQDIMFNYGIVLQNYKANNELVNEAVFTMMHHIIGEVENTTVLFQPTIIKIFINIFDEKDYLYEKWSDLIEYVIIKIVNSPQKECCNQNMSTENIPT